MWLCASLYFINIIETSGSCMIIRPISACGASLPPSVAALLSRDHKQARRHHVLFTLSDTICRRFPIIVVIIITDATTTDGRRRSSRLNGLLGMLCRQGEFLSPELGLDRVGLLVVWLLNVPATCECISGTDLL